MRRWIAGVGLRPILVQQIVWAYIAVAVIPGPRRAALGLEIAIVLGIAAVLVCVLVNLARPVPYVAGVALIAIALWTTQKTPTLGSVEELALRLLFPAGWVLVWASVSSWRLGLATYIAAGMWTLLLYAAPEGMAYLPGHWNDLDSVFWRIVAPVAFWPYVTFGMLGAFGIVFY